VSRFAVDPVTTANDQVGDVVNGNYFINDGGTLLWVSNPTAGVETVSIVVVETVEFMTTGPVVINIAANTLVALVGPFPTSIYSNVLEFDVSDATMQVAAFSLI
jgi:hypothetical protein